MIAPWLLAALLALILAAVALAFARVLRGPTQSDRVVALDVVFAGGIALCVVAALAAQRTVYLDVALGLALVGFVGTLGWARLVQRSRRDAGERR